MAKHEFEAGRRELRSAIFQSRRLLIAVGVFSAFVNILMLTGPIFMLQVYDSVLSSNSEATLAALFGLICALFLFMGLLDHARARVLARVGARFQELLDKRVFDAVLRRAVAASERTKPQNGLRDLETIQRVLSSPAPFALFDMPWAPFFFAIIFSFHWQLGCLALAGGAILLALTIMNEWSSRKPMQESAQASGQSEAFSEALRREGETVQALGMRGAGLRRWRKFREKALETGVRASDRTGSFATASKTMRFFLQSAMLALGALLAIEGVMSPGMMIAGSILMGRALSPLEQAIGQWSNIQRARNGWNNIQELLARTPVEQERTQLPKPKGRIDVQNVTIIPPGQRAPTLRGVNFSVDPGHAVGVIGPSASGKSTLARALVGVWRPAQGVIRLDGAALDQFEDDVLGGNLGYLPQDVSLFEASVAENIARLSDEIDAEAVVTAAKRAGAHDMILQLPDGYDTPAGPTGGQLSGGQRQQIALARALYNDPAVLILDEPNSNLDAMGEQALVNAIKEAKERGRTVIIMAHRPSAIAACDFLLVVENGQPRAFGPKDEVLRQTTANHQKIQQDGAKRLPKQPKSGAKLPPPPGAKPRAPKAPPPQGGQQGQPQQPQPQQGAQKAPPPAGPSDVNTAGTQSQLQAATGETNDDK